jgi:acyl dehydratase
MQFPKSYRHWDDVEVGKVETYGAYEVTKDEIFDYARRYDLQPHHVDEEAAKRSLVGGLCASGWHSCAMFMRVLCDGVLMRAASLGAPGIDEVKWSKPVRPGHVLSARSVCTGKRVMASRPNVGIAQMRHEIVNQHGELLMTMENPQFLAVREPDQAVSRTSGAEARAQQRDRRPASVAAVSGNETATAGEPASAAGNWFEDLVIGRRTLLGSHTFTAEEIKAFARKYDPQAFHLDEEAAKSSLMGALCASGWHTAAHYIRFNITARQQREAEIIARGAPIAIWGPSPGFKELRWAKPVFAGDTITYSQSIAGKVDLKSRPERGLLVQHGEGHNQKGELVYRVTGQILVPRREPLKAQSA